MNGTPDSKDEVPPPYVVPEYLDYPIKREWPACIFGVLLVGLGYLFRDIDFLAFSLYLGGGGLLAWSRFLGSVAAQQSWERSRVELARGEREYLWQAALRWVRGKRRRAV